MLSVSGRAAPPRQKWIVVMRKMREAHFSHNHYPPASAAGAST